MQGFFMRRTKTLTRQRECAGMSLLGRTFQKVRFLTFPFILYMSLNYEVRIRKGTIRLLQDSVWPCESSDQQADQSLRCLPEDA